MNRSFYKNLVFRKGTSPTLPCPSCKEGHLERSEELSVIETVSSRRGRKHEECDPDWVQYNFSGSLVCKKCKETVKFVGKGSPEYYDQYEEDGMPYQAFQDTFF